MTTTHLLYLHGFRSSPQSTKARTMARVVAEQFPSVVWHCPQLPPSPRAAVDSVLQAVHDWPGARMAVIGSSLGGFYATWVAHHKACKLLLLNPAIDPDVTLAQYIGAHTQWHQPEEALYFQSSYIDELRQLRLHGQPAQGPQLGIFAQGDEVLNWRDMVARYPEAEQLVLPGSDHALSEFDALLPRILAFLDLEPANTSS